MTKHLMDMAPDEIMLINCEDCGSNELDAYCCPTHMQDNQPVCMDCCGCPEHSEDN